MSKLPHYDSSYLGKDPIPKLLIRYAVPSTISLLVNSLYNIVDQIFIGRGVGFLGNGATNVIFPITVIAMAFAFMIGDGAASYLSIKLGENDKKKAEQGVIHAILALIFISVLFLIFGEIFLKPAAVLFGATKAILPYALDYGRIIVLGIPFVIISSGLNSCIRADGSPKVAMLSMLIGAVINTVLDPLFIFTFKWGVKGAAAATVIGQFATFLICVLYIPRFKNITIAKEKIKFDFKVIRTVASYGVSSFITQISITVAMFVVNNALVKYGALSKYGSDIAITALGIVMKVNQILISFIVGIAIGAQPIIGYNYGAGNLKRVKKTYLTACVLSTAVTVIGFLIFQLTPQTVINLFGSENGLYNEFAQKCFRIFLFVVYLNGFQITTGIFFQSIGKPLKATVITMCRQILALIPAMLILPRFFGINGVLYAGPTADALAFLVAFGLSVFEMIELNKQGDKTFPVQY